MLSGMDDAANGRADHLIALRQVSKTFETVAGPFFALRDVSVEIDRREFVAVIGKSGSGKSTLVNMIAGIDRPTAGEVWVHGTPIHRLSEGQLARWRGQSLGIVFQFFQLLPTLTAEENVMLPMDFAGRLRPAERAAEARRRLGQVGLAGNAGQLPATLSGGEQQRVAIARALANDPPLLLADEPTGNLDSRTAEAVIELFEQLVAEGKTIVMVTHDLDLAARATRTIRLVDGTIAQDGPGTATNGSGLEAAMAEEAHD
jgi:putative ABC transport system ATP-binding protein